jgi:hypothetical protein
MKRKIKLLLADRGALAGAALLIAIFALVGGAAIWIKSNIG